MKIILGKLHYPEEWWDPEVYLFTANRCLNSRGELVMGAGAAKAVKKAFPEAPSLLGRAMAHNPDLNVPRVRLQGGQQLGAVQVKYDWRDPASPQLIVNSFKELDSICRTGGLICHCNFPGVGKGQLSLEYVNSLLCPLELHENIHLYLDI